MNLQRTPPQATLTGASGSGGGSTPNLTTIDYDSTGNVNTRKRKERSEQEEYKNDFENFRSEIMNFFKEFAATQNSNSSIIREEITIKSITENYAQQLEQVKEDIKNIKNDYSMTQEKMKNLEKEISDIKSADCSDNLTSKSSLPCQEHLILELQERSEGAKNLVVTGITEINDKNYNTRGNHDIEEFMNLVTYIPGKDRPLKICFDDGVTPKLLLKNKAKFPENMRIYYDQTPAQKNHLQTVKNELKKRLENGETDLIIKYIKGIPRIVKDKINKKN
ncbi:hypothetical protein ABMA27_016976 [Loxostege sticticalis]|uniref:Uncharacterized protein n=1 Tax=Loxostege sticticalis TaxID=481309 RepID=A0ABR3GYG4_LOXSC